MNRLSTRLAKLEMARGVTEFPAPVAVVRSPFPAGDAQEWATGILDRIGCKAAVWVLEGAEFEALLPPLWISDETMPSDSDAERQWLAAGRTYPHVLIYGEPGGGALVERFESEAHERARRQELYKELEEQGG